MGNIGGDHVPVVISSHQKDETEVVSNIDQRPDYIYLGSEKPRQFKAGQDYIVDYNVYDAWNSDPATTGAHLWPIFPVMAMPLSYSSVLPPRNISLV